MTSARQGLSSTAATFVPSVCWFVGIPLPCHRDSADHPVLPIAWRFVQCSVDGIHDLSICDRRWDSDTELECDYAITHPFAFLYHSYALALALARVAHLTLCFMTQRSGCPLREPLPTGRYSQANQRPSASSTGSVL